MDIIPVIDLMQGQVVRARRGDRQHYRPIESGLCPGTSAPLEVVRALLELYPFNKLYIADLDAIRGGAPHLGTVLDIRTYHPELEIWLDAGCRTPLELDRWHGSDVRHVIGSENLSSTAQLHTLLQCLDPATTILSLDYAHAGPLGPQEIFEDATLWPATVIAMTLTKVGSESGPDMTTLQSLNMRASEQNIIAAGGIRNIDDLQALAGMRIAGALIASALHDGHIAQADITRISSAP